MRLLYFILLWTASSVVFAQDAKPSAPLHLRIMTGNLTSGKIQSYDQGHGSRIFQGLQPDVALVQEFKFGDNTPAAVSGWVKAVFGLTPSYYREEQALPNGIVSRFPILDSGSWEDADQDNRDFAWARIQLPGGRILRAVSVHLSATKQDKRIKEANALVFAIKQNVAPSELLVVGGDFNTSTRTDPAVSILKEVVIIASPYPADEAGNDNTNKIRTKPYDWVVANQALDEKKTPVALGGSPGGLVFDSRVFSDLGKVSPVQKDDSDADQMQHMAVVRDFLLD